MATKFCMHTNDIFPNILTCFQAQKNGSFNFFCNFAFRIYTFAHFSHTQIPCLLLGLQKLSAAVQIFVNHIQKVS